MRLHNNKYILVVLALVLLVLTVGCEVIIEHTSTEGILELHTIDVGQGDSILIIFPNGQKALIDGGTRKMGDRVVDYLKKLKIDSIDYLIATHPHEDHIGGLIKIIDTFKIGNIYMPDVEHTSKTFFDLLETIEKNNYKMKKAKSGVSILDEGDLKAYFLAPVKDSYKKLNDYSAVLKVDYKEVSILLTGDAESESEQDILNKYKNLKADILKVGHHGSSTSSTEEFLMAVRPTYGIISLGADNSYGHPHKETIDKLSKMGVKILRTDKDGSIVFKTDGKEINRD